MSPAAPKRKSGTPRLCEWALSFVVARRDREAFLGDMRDAFDEEEKREGLLSARRWYRRQTLGSMVPLLRRRWEQRSVDKGGVVRDLRFILRELSRRPGYALAVAGTMAIGSGVAIAVTGIAKATVFHQLPYANAQRVIVLRSFDLSKGELPGAIAGPDYFDYRDRLQSVSSLSAAELAPTTMRIGTGPPRRVDAALISASTLGVLGVAPVGGRGFVAGDSVPGAEAVAIVREGFGDLDAGDDVTLDGVSHTIVGIAPRDIRFPSSDTVLWRPLRIRPDSYNRRARILTVIGLLSAEHSLDDASAEAERVAVQLQEEHPGTNGTRDVMLTPLATVLTEPIHRPLRLLSWAAGLVLVLAYANAAALMLARATLRHRESVLRTALGASVAAELRRFVLEGTALSFVGGCLGVGVAGLAWAVVPSLAPPGTLELAGPPFDRELALLIVIASILLGAFVGGALGYPLARAGSKDAWRSRNGGDRKVGTAHRTLVVGQVVAAVVLASSAVLLVRSLVKLQDVDLGFQPDHTLVARVDLPSTRYPTGMSQYPRWPEVQTFYRRLTERLRQSPGIAAAALAWHHPLAPAFQMDYRVEGPTSANHEGRVSIRAISPGYVGAVGKRLITGRDLSADDRMDDPPIVLVNQAFVRAAFNGRDAVGRRVETFGRVWEIVGVVGDVASLAIGQTVAPAIFPPMTQMPSEFFTVVVRSETDPVSVSLLVIDAVHSIDPELAPYDVMPLSDAVRRVTAPPRFAAALGASLGGVSVLLASTGILALLTLNVRLRRREIGVRLALGASPEAIRRQQVGNGVRLAAVGLVIGLPAAVMTSSALRGVLYGIDAVDPTTYVCVTAAVAAMAVVASYGPARLAAGIDPQVGLSADDG